MNAGVERRIGQSVRLNATYTHRRGDQMLRARNLNAPVDGVRPDAGFSNVVEVVDDASARTHMLTVSGSLIMLQARQTFLAGNYTLASSESNTTGAFSLPANGNDLATEWGPTTPRHRFGASFNTRPFGSFGVAINARYQSGTPYTLTAGADLNGDGVFNDRPAGVGRNSLLTASQWDVGMRLSYALGFGGPRESGGSGGGTAVIIRTGGGMPMGGPGGPGNDRYRVELYASAQNITNHYNYIGYSGVIASPFFQQPTNVMNPRKIEVGMRFGF
jgi:hypothetical protein